MPTTTSNAIHVEKGGIDDETESRDGCPYAQTRL